MTAPCPIPGLTEEQSDNLWRLYTSGDPEQAEQAGELALMAGVEIPTLWVARRVHTAGVRHRVMSSEAVTSASMATAEAIGRLRGPMSACGAVVTIQAKALQSIAQRFRCAEMPYTIPPHSQKTR